MKDFIEVPQEEGSVSINIKNIFLIEKRKNGYTRISSLIEQGNDNYEYQYVDTPLTYEQVEELIPDGQMQWHLCQF
jgi:hypothetical protein